MSDEDQHNPRSDLRTRIAAGDSAAQSEAYELHRNRTFSAVYRIIGRTADALDITHDAFVIAFDRVSELRNDEAFGGWLRTIAVRLAVRAIKRDRWELLGSDDSIAPAVVLPTSPAAIDLDNAIRKLPRALRGAFVLQAVEGYSYADAAIALGITEVACRQRVHRARVQLAEELSDYE